MIYALMHLDYLQWNMAAIIICCIVRWPNNNIYLEVAGSRWVNISKVSFYKSMMLISSPWVKIWKTIFAFHFKIRLGGKWSINLEQFQTPVWLLSLYFSLLIFRLIYLKISFSLINKYQMPFRLIWLFIYQIPFVATNGNIAFC